MYCMITVLAFPAASSRARRISRENARFRQEVDDFLAEGWGRRDWVGCAKAGTTALPLTVLPDISPRKRGERRWPRRFRQSSMGRAPKPESLRSVAWALRSEALSVLGDGRAEGAALAAGASGSRSAHIVSLGPIGRHDELPQGERADSDLVPEFHILNPLRILLPNSDVLCRRQVNPR